MYKNRLQIKDFDDRLISLPDNEHYWDLLYKSKNKANNILLLGTGNVDPKILNFIDIGSKIYWMESPKVQKNKNFNSAVLSNYNYLSSVDTNKFTNIVLDSNIYFYKPGLRIDPDFWGHIISKIDKIKYLIDDKISRDTISNTLNFYVPGNSKQLIHDELLLSIRNLGHNILEYGASLNEYKLILKKFSTLLPDIVLSINFRGLEPEGRIFNFFTNLSIPVIIWFVDNPYNILSSVKLPWWKHAYIYVTDPSFIKELKDLGAKHVDFLPLAASWHMFKNTSMPGNESPLFIGRSEFPDKKNFFKGTQLDMEAYNRGINIFENNYQREKIPDYHWWVKALNCGLWPRDNRRNAALAAENISMLNRLRWIKEALKSGLRIYGDSGWNKFFPETNINKPIDYYGSLASLYGNAQAVLNVTSCLLPQSLNQRHFDVWAANGFLLTDNTEGLNIFPDHLTKSIKLNCPQDFNKKIIYFNKNITERNELKREWHNYIINNHTYDKRISKIINDCIR